MNDLEQVPGEPLLAVGSIIRPHGLRGAVVVMPDSDNPERFLAGETLLLERAPSRYEAVTIEMAAPHGDKVRLKLAGCESREEAEALCGRTLLVREQDAPLAAGEYWLHELAGMTVQDEGGAVLGTVTEAREGTAHELLVVESESGDEFMVPFVSEFVLAVDREGRVITVRLIEGMGP